MWKFCTWAKSYVSEYDIVYQGMNFGYWRWNAYVCMYSNTQFCSLACNCLHYQNEQGFTNNFMPGANPTIVSYNASAVKIYTAGTWAFFKTWKKTLLFSKRTRLYLLMGAKHAVEIDIFVEPIKKCFLRLFYSASLHPSSSNARFL
jgi:hypothetical protein